MTDIPRKLLAGSMALALLAGCASRQPAERQAEQPAEPEPEQETAQAPAEPAEPESREVSRDVVKPSHPVRYTVRRGDTLWDIAARSSCAIPGVAGDLERQPADREPAPDLSRRHHHAGLRRRRAPAAGRPARRRAPGHPGGRPRGGQALAAGARAPARRGHPVDPRRRHPPVPQPPARGHPGAARRGALRPRQLRGAPDQRRGQRRVRARLRQRPARVRPLQRGAPRRRAGRPGHRRDAGLRGDPRRPGPPCARPARPRACS
ncbi:MAG: LysM domain-containing protein [Halofilum sp. (in: g-proteobacteria)]|nr:LysM domain-containing protein [Halofilum sp. (in: g-proteobacteria)]